MAGVRCGHDARGDLRNGESNRGGQCKKLKITFFDKSRGALIKIFKNDRSNSTYRWVNLGAAFLIHTPLEIDDFEGLSYYYGGGVNAYFWSYDFNIGEPSTTLGVSGYLGLDYAFEDIPLNITFDWSPTVFFRGVLGGFGGLYGGAGIRYIFARE